MKKNYYYSFLLILFISVTVCGQTNNKIIDGVAFQKTLTFENKLTTDAAIASFAKVYKLGKGNSFEAKKASIDKVGMTHQRQQQFYNGIKVEFGMLITHTLNGKVLSINGELYNASELNLTPTLTKTEGLTKAIISTNAQKFLWEDEENAKIMDYKKPEGELVIFPIVKTGEVKLAYKYDVYTTQPISRAEIFVDAHTGQILFKNAIIKHANGLISDKQKATYSDKIEMLVTGNAATRYQGARNIETKLVGTNYILNDNTRGSGIETYNSATTKTYPSTNFTDSDNDWSDGRYSANDPSKDNAALDAHWGAEMTYDFWLNIFGRKSYDDNNSKLKSYVHYDLAYDNAFWNGSVMSYGDGSTFKILTALDVCGHEIGHGVCQQTASLAYQNQSGGINEGYSDIWGACIEQYTLTGTLNGTPRTGNGTTITTGFDYNSNVWLIGEDIATGGLRSMKSPRIKQNPDTYLGQYWTATGDEGSCVPDNTSANTNDHCGVHGNSGVLNQWFYIVTAGKASTNTQITPNYSYFVNGIGMAKSSEIIYLTERDYLTPNSTYADARLASLTVTENLYCVASPEYKSVQDAWYAVNVGPKYVGAPDDVKLKSIVNSASVACNSSSAPSIIFQNVGTNPITSVTITYNVDGGANSVETWTGNLNPCTSQNYTLALSFSGLTRGAHTLTVDTTFANDGVATNNSQTASIVINDSGVVNVINPFDLPTDALVSFDEVGTNTVWERGTSAKTNLTDAVAGGSQVYATKLSGLYPDKTKAYLVSQCYDLSNATNPVIKFDMAYDLEKDFDILYMEYSTDGTTWNVLGTGTSATWYTNSRLPNGTDCQNCIGGQWNGEANATHPNGGINAKMRPYSYDLSAFGSAGTPQSNIIFRFVFQSDDSLALDGAIIDNFVVEATLGTAVNNFNTFAVSPNPSKGTVLLSLSASSDVKVNLFDIMGRNIYSKTYSNSNTIFNQELQFNNLSKGIYLLNVESDGKKASKKLIIE